MSQAASIPANYQMSSARPKVKISSSTAETEANLNKEVSDSARTSLGLVNENLIICAGIVLVSVISLFVITMFLVHNAVKTRKVCIYGVHSYNLIQL